MGLFDWGNDNNAQQNWQGAADNYNQVQNAPPAEHHASFGHEAIAGAAGFGAMKLFEDQQRREGKTVNHAFAKELIAGIAGGEVDKLFEDKGLNAYDQWRDRREQTKQQAQQQAVNMYEQHYERGMGADQYDPNQYQQNQQFDQYNQNY